MSNGIKGDYRSTVVVLFKGGGNATTKSIEEPKVLQQRFEDVLLSPSNQGFIKVITGDEDDSIGYYNSSEIAFFAVQNYVDEETARKRIIAKQELAKAGPKSESRIITRR